MSLLTLIQSTSYLIGLPSPSVAYASTDTRIQELISFANSIGDKIARDYQWQELTKEATFDATGTVSMGSLTGSIATDFGYFINQTFWDRDAKMPILGPATPQEWQADLSSGFVSPPYKFVVQSGLLKVGPTAIAAGHDMVFNYITKYWCQSSGGTGQTAFAADTDTTVIPEELFKLELIWRWKASKGLSYAEDLQTSEQAIQAYTGQNQGSRVLFIGGNAIYYIGGNVPQGDWPSS